jgi:hypothetical protein
MGAKPTVDERRRIVASILKEGSHNQQRMSFLEFEQLMSRVPDFTTSFVIEFA